MSDTIKLFIGTSDDNDTIAEQIYLYSLYKNTNAKLVLYFHNDPLTMNGSKYLNLNLLV